jgi:type II secretory pathway component GspD/PulD (secretin)
VSDITGSTVDVGQGVTAPIFFKREADTTVTVKDNETVVLGGLITSRDELIEQKIPIVGDLPLLGLLFRNHTHTNTRTELLLVLTPRIVRTIEDYREVSIQERDRTGTIPPEIQSSPLMQGLQVKPEDLQPATSDKELGPFPAPASAPAPMEEEYGPTPGEKPESNPPDSYDVPVSARIAKPVSLAGK